MSQKSRAAAGGIGIMLFLTACAPQDIEPSSGKARFSEFPEPLFAAFRESCTGPARTFRSSGRNNAECMELMPPYLTAAFILDYTGITEDLPRLVIRFQAEPDAGSFVVQNDLFVNVPQREGAPRQIPFESQNLRRQLDVLYVNAGGVPEP